MSTFANKRYDMNKFPTSYEIFGLDCLGEEASESLKMVTIQFRPSCNQTKNPEVIPGIFCIGMAEVV